MGNLFACATTQTPTDQMEYDEIMITSNTYLIMPTIELREFIRQLRRCNKIPTSEIDTFLLLIPYMSNYQYYPDDQSVCKGIIVNYRSRASFCYHIGLTELTHYHKLILTRYHAEILLDFETRACISGSTPALNDLADRIKQPPIYSIPTHA